MIYFFFLFFFFNLFKIILQIDKRMYYIVEFYSNSTSNNYFLFSFEDGTNSISSYRSIFDFIDESKTTFDSFLRLLQIDHQ